MPKIMLEGLERQSGSSYPAPFDAPCNPRNWRRIAAAGGLTQLGANLVTLPPGCWSSQRHTHTHEDELIVILQGEPTLIEDDGETQLKPGDICTHPAASPNGHHMINRTDANVVFLVCSNLHPDDKCFYPDIDMTAETGPDGKGLYRHKDGTPYPPKP